MSMQLYTQEETTSTRKILSVLDPESDAVITHDAARAQLLPRLRLPRIRNEDGTVTEPLDTFEAAWRIIDHDGAGFMNNKQVSQLVRLMGYAQTAENLATAKSGAISEMLRKVGPSCRLYEWIVPEQKTFVKPPTESEAILVDAILREGDPDAGAFLSGDAAKVVFRRSGLDNRTLATIWEIVDEHERGFLQERDVLRMVRLISCAQRGLRTHPRQAEIPCPLPDLDDSLVEPVVAQPAPPPSTAVPPPSFPTAAPPSFPVARPHPPSFPTPQLSLPNGANSNWSGPSRSFGPSLSIPTRPPDDPLPALTDKQKQAFMTIFDKNNPQGDLITGAQGITILERSQLPRNVLADIWDLADEDRSGSLSRGEFVIVMYLVKLVMDRRRANPGHEDEQVPKTIPQWLRAEAARVEGEPTATATNGGVTPERIPTRYMPPHGPPPPSTATSAPTISLLDLDNEEPANSDISRPNRSAVTTPGPSQTGGSGLQDYLNRPVPPTPPELLHRRSEEAPPPYVEIDYAQAHSRVRSVS